MIDHFRDGTKMVTRSMSMEMMSMASMMSSMVDRRHVDRTQYMVRS
jgi:hypothetical protein